MKDKLITGYSVSSKIQACLLRGLQFADCTQLRLLDAWVVSEGVLVRIWLLQPAWIRNGRVFYSKSTSLQLCGTSLIGNEGGPVTHLMDTCRGTLQAVGNVMGSLYLSVLFLGDCLKFPSCCCTCMCTSVCSQAPTM